MWGKESSRGPQPFKLAGSHQPINSCLTQGRHSITSAFRMGKTQRKTRERRAAAAQERPGVQGLSGWAGWGSVAPVQPLQELHGSCRAKHPVPPRCFLEAEISPALEINVSLTPEPPASLHFFLVSASLSSSTVSSCFLGMSSLTMPRAAPAPALRTGLEVRLEILPAHPSLRRNLSFQGGRAACGKAESPGT